MVGAAGAERLLVADNFSDDVLLLDAATGAVVKRFDLAETDAVPSVYPVALAVAKDERGRLWRCGTRLKWWSLI